MPENKIIGYKKMFGLVLPDWVNEKQINMAIGYVLVSVVMLFVMILVIQPNNDRIKTNRKAYDAELAKLTNLQTSKKSLDNLSSNINEIEQGAIFRAMPVNYSPEEAVFELRNIAASAGVTIVEYSLPPGVVFEDVKKEFTGSTAVKNEASVKFKSFPITISLSGDINSILNFIDKVEKSLPIGFVSDLGIQEATKMSNSARTEARLKLQVTYYQPIMVSFNLGNLQEFTKDDLGLIKELGGYAQTSFQVGSGPSSTVNEPAGDSGNQNVFGL